MLCKRHRAGKRHKIVRKSDSSWRSQASEQHERRANECRQHAAGSERQPEYGRYRSFHGCIHTATSTTIMKVAAATATPVAVIPICGKTRPPMARRGMVFGKI